MRSPGCLVYVDDDERCDIRERTRCKPSLLGSRDSRVLADCINSLTRKSSGSLQHRSTLASSVQLPVTIGSSVHSLVLGYSLTLLAVFGSVPPIRVLRRPLSRKRSARPIFASSA
ncbi:multidrug resistance protein [Pseudozyma hubeiensis SY62]|uniref:Multidrug resistance protein n=1 Tax=Pseudozyma hubeiensis (strain SY62) TaxID=1305764 RepID=R9PCW7_PSEHS|nr:multidrug resistance protein [Pseudozyma hubeiensis SY62]GAC99204.1 multidrug resistance protein [Pseudozyma hubeiensis SY62]